MAHGKSLELKKFDEEHSLRNRQKLLCLCGEVWASEVHFTKKDKLRKDIAGDKSHIPTGQNGMMVKAVAAHQAGWKAPKKKAS